MAEHFYSLRTINRPAKHLSNPIVFYWEKITECYTTVLPTAIKAALAAEETGIYCMPVFLSRLRKYENFIFLAGYALGDRRELMSPANFEQQMFLHANSSLWGVADINSILQQYTNEMEYFSPMIYSCKDLTYDILFWKLLRNIYSQTPTYIQL